MSISVSGALKQMAESNTAGGFVISKESLLGMKNGAEIVNCSTLEASEKLFQHALVVLPFQEDENDLFFLDARLFRDALRLIQEGATDQDEYDDGLYLAISITEGLVESEMIDIDKYRALYL